MSYEYTVPKKKFCKESVIERLKIFFENGDSLEIRKREIIDISIDFYDSLICGERGAYPVAKRGFIKLKIQDSGSRGASCFLYNPRDYKAQRMHYIENRLTKQGAIKCISLYNCNGWSDTVFGDIYVTCEDGFLFLRFKENERYGSFDSENHTISLRNISKSLIRTVDIDFENCESFEIYGDEIIDLQFNFESHLDWNSDGYIRCVKNGYMIIKLDPDYNNDRDESVYSCKRGKKMTRCLEKRICGKNFDFTDICNLYITYDFNSYGSFVKEMITLPYISASGKWTTFVNERELDGYYPDEYEFYYSEDDEEDNFPYISGYAQKQRDGTILIVFGKKPPATLNFGEFYEQYKNILYSCPKDEQEN